MLSWLPGGDAAVWSETAGVAVLAPILLPIGYYMMRYPRSALLVGHVATVEDEASFTGFAVARKQAAGFVAASLGASALWFAAVSMGVPPVTLPLLVVVGGLAFGLSVRASDSRVQYLGIGVGVVAGGCLLTLLFAVVFG
ncbi:hypothetical protein [Halorarius litoreus]|uniref:hypothetical protein n=1 Tax=Halorarius litoreus TaxID=2962676 RepID=UPI0020CFD27B|nr:hypothetical protein [Halorarius litoreus]